MTNQIAEIEPTVLPSSYKELGVKTGYSPVTPEQTRHFIVGPIGEGKTTFLAGIPRTIILDFELHGAEGIPNPRAFRLRIDTPEKLTAIFKVLEADAKNPKRPFDRVCFDTADQWIEVLNLDLALTYKVKDIRLYGSKGAGYEILKRECWSQLQWLQKMGYTWTCTGHMTEKTITVNDKERTVLRPVLFPTLAAVIARNCELMSTVHMATEKEQLYRTVKGRDIPAGFKDVTKVYMDTMNVGGTFSTLQGKRRGVPTMKSRIVIPDSTEKKYGWDVFVTEYNRAVQEMKEKE